MVNIPLKLSSLLATYFEYEYLVTIEDLTERQYCSSLLNETVFSLLKQKNEVTRLYERV